MHYATIKPFDVANGPGVRVSLFVSGCTHRCKECFNEVAWDFTYGEEFNETVQQKILELLKPQHIQGLSLLGGEPLEIANQKGLLPFVKKVKEELPQKTIWCYTGYVLEDLMENGKVHSSSTDELLRCIDVLVDGPFILEKKDLMLQFKGSSNQRLIDLQKTLDQGKIVLWKE